METNVRIGREHKELIESQIKPIVDGMDRVRPEDDRVQALLKRRKHVTSAIASLEQSQQDKCKLAPMVVVSFARFSAHGSIPRRSVHDASPLHVDVSELPETAKIVFVSQRWLSVKSPDDENKTKFHALVSAVTAWAEQERVQLESVYVVSSQGRSGSWS